MRKSNKKNIFLILIILVILLSFCACDKSNTQSAYPTESFRVVSNNTATPTHSATATVEVTEIPTESATATVEATNTPTESATATVEATETPTESATATVEVTETPTESATTTVEATETPTESATATVEATKAPTQTPITPSVCNHTYEDASCTKPKKCMWCGITKGSAKGHNWISATCKAPQTCIECGITQGVKREHCWEKQVTKQPTNVSQGEMTYTCYLCNEVNIEIIDKYNFDPDAYGKLDYIRTSNNPDNFVEYKIIEDTLTITGKIIKEDLCVIAFDCGNNDSKLLPVSSGEAFSVEFYLDDITEKSFVEIYTRCQNDIYYWGYIYESIAVTPSDDGGYCFTKSLVLDNNINVMKQWRDPRDYLSDAISPTLKTLSDEIVGDEKDTYQKMYLLNKWVAENIYYDYDYYEGKSDEIYYYADDVYKHKRTVCSGYAKLLITLLRAQGISAMEVHTFSTGISTIGVFDETNYQTTDTNHAHVEAYLESEKRWVVMDPTWDSGNKYRNGEFLKGSFSGVYFDMNLDMFSFTHKLISRGV